MMKILSIERKRSTFACKSTGISKDVNIKEAKEELDAVINQEKKKGMSIKEMIREGKPIKEILKVVKEDNIDLIIMLAHSEWRLEHFLFGRIKEEII
ncbi:MAG: universal stress protein [Nitrospirota bacterium]